MKTIAVYSVCLFLWGCAPADETLQSAVQVEPWIEKVKRNAEQPLNAELGNMALFSVEMPDHAKDMFLPAPHLTAKLANTVPRKPSPSSFGIEWASSLPPPAKNINLSQASANELKYAGLLTRDGQAVGMVQVLQRLYPVHVGDKIGAGQWPVLSLNAQTMQIKMAQKAVVYDKK